MSENYFNIDYPGYAPLEIKLKQSEDFLKIRETLTRIGVSSRKDKILYQSCHILHKKGRYFITHFKELFALDGKDADLDDTDLQRRNTIAKLLSDWSLLEILHPEKHEDTAPLNQIKILPFKEKSEWELVTKYNIGKR
ncbi:MAG: translation repressor protein [Candidatus Endolissoclinum sp. TMED37]|nr:MAG: translation repressor protein [Candidatus Endolissoclinum sp. TMED37]